MRITASAVSVAVADVSASRSFLESTLGFRAVMEAPGFASLAHDDAGMNVIFLEEGLGTFKPESHRGTAGQGLLLVFVVEDVDREWERLRDAVTIVTPIETEPWGERYFQMLDPNGIVIQLVQWMDGAEPDRQSDQM